MIPVSVSCSLAAIAVLHETPFSMSAFDIQGSTAFIVRGTSHASALARIDPDLLAKSDPHRPLEEAVWRKANVGSSRSGPPGDQLVREK
jgi:hypothetical protein